MNQYDWKNKSILIVEDDHANMLFLTKLLAKTNVNYHEALDGKTALNLFKTHEDIDLVLMDIRLPDTNGYDLTNIFKIIREDVKIIAQTAFAMEEDRIRCLKAGCDDYVPKPIDKELLMNKIKKTCKVGAFG